MSDLRRQKEEEGLCKPLPKKFNLNIHSSRNNTSSFWRERPSSVSRRLLFLGDGIQSQNQSEWSLSHGSPDPLVNQYCSLKNKVGFDVIDYLAFSGNDFCESPCSYDQGTSAQHLSYTS